MQRFVPVRVLLQALRTTITAIDGPMVAALHTDSMSLYESCMPLLAKQGIRYLRCLVKHGHQAAALNEFEHTQQGRHIMKAANGSVTSSDVIASDDPIDWPP